MKSLYPKTVGIVLLVALAIESVNFWLLTPPIDVGYSAGTAWYVQLIGLQWRVLHAPGLFSLSWFEHVVGCGQANIVMGCRRVDLAVLFVSGYLTTSSLLIAITFIFWRFMRKTDVCHDGRIGE